VRALPGRLIRQKIRKFAQSTSARPTFICKIRDWCWYLHIVMRLLNPRAACSLGVCVSRITRDVQLKIKANR